MSGEQAGPTEALNYESGDGDDGGAPPRRAAPHVLPLAPVVANEAGAALRLRDLGDVWAFRELLYFLTWRDIRVRYKQTAMGAAWAIIQPLVMMLVFAVVFGMMGVPTDGMPYFIFFYCGLLPWTFFSGAVTNSSLSLVTNGNLISKVYFPRVLIPTATIGAGLVDLAVASVILVLLAFYYGMPATRNLLMLPVLVVLTVLMSLGLGMWLAALTVKYRDVRHVLPFTLQVWFFVTPIIYPANLLDVKWRWLLYLNPMTGIVEGLRSAISGRAFDWPSIAFSATVTLAVLVISIFAFNRIEKSFADLI
ncbi:MAG TPA: ABC transporter permease [Pyrinomonadaceae bacterium]